MTGDHEMEPLSVIGLGNLKKENGKNKAITELDIQVALIARD